MHQTMQQAESPVNWGVVASTVAVVAGVAAVAALGTSSPNTLYVAPATQAATVKLPRALPRASLAGVRATTSIAARMPHAESHRAEATAVEPYSDSQLKSVSQLGATWTLSVSLLASMVVAAAVYRVRSFWRVPRNGDPIRVALLATSGRKTQPTSQDSTDFVMQMPGILPPTGFFDPAGLSRMKTPDQLMYAREAELKHGRIAMLAALGFPFAEEFHPIFPGDNAPSDFSFQLTPLQTYWPLVVLGVGLLETFSIKTFKEGGFKYFKDDHVSGDLGFDPLGLKPEDPEKLLERQNRELSNGRLAMIAIAGMVAQELVVRADVFQTDVSEIQALETAAGTELQVIEGLAGFTSSVAMFAASGRKTQPTSQDSTDFVMQMPGILPPTGFFDPAGLSRMKTPDQLMYAREAELKHGRIAMLAALGFPFAEEFHPIFPGDNAPSDFSFQLTPLQTYWPLVVLGVGLLETFSIKTFKEGGFKYFKDDHVSGDLGFDPLGLKPEDPEKLLERQNRELSNGRLAMIAIAGMVAQELVVRADVFQTDVSEIQALETAAGTELQVIEGLAGFTSSVAMFAASGRKTQPTSQDSTDFVMQMPGILPPTGFFDPAGLSRMKTPDQLMYAREAELKHGRIAMLAALGFPFAEEFHPIFPGDNAPSDFSFQLTPLQTYWPLVVLGVGLLETFSIKTFKEGGFKYFKDDHVSGDLGFDPLGLKPEDPEKLLERQNRELSNGRLAMIAIAGMVAQELVVRADVFQTDVSEIQALETAAGTELQVIEGLAGFTSSVAMFAASGRKTQPTSQDSTDFVMQMPGILPPTGFFDPAGLSRMKTPDQLMYAREAELKHGRIAMLAALGFPFAEEFHPIFPGDNAPSDFSFQLTPLQTYWPLVVLGVGLLETFSIKTFKEGGFKYFKDDHVSGDLGFDPLGLKPEDPEKLLERQNRELSNGRLAMIAIAGMVAQELVVRADVFQTDVSEIQALETAAGTELQVIEGLAGFTSSVAMFAASGRKTQPTSQDSTDFVMQMPGILPPTGFFDPAGLSRMKTPDQLMYAREAELKHGRIAMLAALGFPFAEEFHPIFPGDNAPSDFSFQLTPLQTYWPLVVLGVGLLETFSIKTFKEGGFKYFKDDHVSGDLGFDPLGLKPEDPEKLLERQNRELSNGRLAMIAIAGMVAQELVVRADVFQTDVSEIQALETAAGTELQVIEGLAGFTSSVAMFAASGRKTQPTSQDSTDFVMQMPGILPPTGFFDPAGLSRMKTPDQLMYAREAELKHGRIAMLAALGFPFAEEFHPIFPGDNAPSDFSFQLTPLQTYWPLVVLGVGLLETFSIKTFKEGGFKYFKDDHVSGDLGFDPLGLKPEDPEKLLERQNRELSNGRLAMIAIAGMVAQELVVRADVFQTDVSEIQALETAAGTELQVIEGLAGFTSSVAMFAASGRKTQPTSQDSTDFVMQMPGILPPTGFFDPAGLSRMKTPDQLMYAREAELKHGRIAMLAALGFPFAEEFHPIFPGDNAPSDFSFQLTPLQTYWPLVVLGVGLLETFSIKTFKEGGFKYFKDDHVSGDLGFDPLGLKPEDPEKLLERQNRELSNGRLAMIAIAGMVAQELVVRADVFQTDVSEIQALETAAGTELQVIEGLAGFTSSVAMFAASGRKTQLTSQDSTDFVMQMPGILPPTGFFDPAGLSRMKTPDQLMYAREAELKHGRIAMLAALGFPFAEEFHPIFPGDNAPSDFSFQLTPLQTYWPLVVLGVGLLETFSIKTFKEGGFKYFKDDHVSGDLGFDPLGLKPEDPEKLLERQNRELSNGRLAMIAIAGMVAQELVVRADVFQTDVSEIQALETAAGTELQVIEGLAGFTSSVAMF